jgi:hypothetical protein
MHISTSGGPGQVSTNFYGSSSNPVTLASYATPSIDWNVTLSISGNNGFPIYTVQYTHDCFPAYELYAGNQRIYDYKPSSYNPMSFAACLAGFGQINGIKRGSLY